MSTPILMPKLGESVVEGTVTRWLKQPGERVEKMEPLLEISTDKIDTEAPAPASGVLLAILVPAGATVAAGTLLGSIGDAIAERATGATLPSENTSPTPQPSNGESGSKNLPQGSRATTQSRHGPGRTFLSPVVRRIAREHQVDVHQVSGSGLGGRITKKDMLAFVAKEQSAGLSGDQPMPSVRPAPGGVPDVALAPDETLHPLTTMRRAIAQHMMHSKQSSPHAVAIFEVDMTAVVQHRERRKAELAERGVKLTFTPYFVAAATSALRAVPLVNSRFSDQGIVVNRRIHVGVAVAVENGLLVPVIRDADEKNLIGLARAVGDLAERARMGKLAPDELSGGTFTITNHGVDGSLVGAPIINQPQAAILGVGAIAKRPVVRSSSPSLLPSADDALVIRPICYLSLSFDHRILDGAGAGQFLTVIKETLENWPEAK